MRQKFFTTTIQSNFIKNLLLNTALPIHNSINYNDYLIKDNVYLYKTNLLKCTKSGWFNVEETINTLIPQTSELQFYMSDVGYAALISNNSSIVNRFFDLGFNNQILTIMISTAQGNNTYKFYPEINPYNFAEYFWKNPNYTDFYLYLTDTGYLFLVSNDSSNFWQLGDVDQDRVVTLDDVALVTAYLNGQSDLSDIQLILANINNDTRVNTSDITQIKRIINGTRDPEYVLLSPTVTQLGSISIEISDINLDNMVLAETQTINSSFYFGQWYIKDTQIFESNQLAYDSDTHRYLGEYLRFYRDLFGTNLMPFYNCFSGIYTSKFYISEITKTISEGASDITYRTVKQTAYDFYQQGNSDLSSRYHTKETFKVLQVPIKFNKKYTIAIECNAPVLIAPAFISNGQLVSTYYAGQKIDLTDILNSPESDGKLKNYEYANMYFNDPVVIEIANRDESILVNEDSSKGLSALSKSQVLQRYERDLYLLIQLPIENNSSVVVLEGDYTNASTEKYFNLECFTNPEMEAPSQEFLDSVLLSNLSLLQFNDYTRYPFADRLVEYLLWQVIDSTDEIGPNVSKIQTALSVNLQNHTKGYYDDYLRALVFNTFRDSGKYTDLDNNGNVDKDVEKYLFG